MFIIEKIDSSDKSFLPLTTAWIRWVSFEDRAIRVELRSEEIAASPPFEPESMSDYRFERQLYEHYRHCRTRR
jgi:hypothetical protein